MNTIGIIFTRGCATRENSTDGVYFDEINFYLSPIKHLSSYLFIREEAPAPEAGPSSIEATPATPETKPIERSVEFRNTDDSMASMVRCLYFADTFIANRKY